LKTKIKNILLVDDHKLILDGLSKLLSGYDDISVIDVAQQGEEALKKIQTFKINFVLLDISMPGMNGIETLKQIKKISPSIKVVMLTMFHDFTNVAGALHFGADGYLLKDCGIDELLKAFHVVENDGVYISPEIKNMLKSFHNINVKDIKNIPNPYTLFTERELQLARMFADGKTSNEIAAEKFISITTVETHRRNIFQKLNINKTASLVRYMFENGLM
jgi:DNA-binding NarL/FixJ family response regulator